MEAEVTSMASGSSSKLDGRMHCVTCGIHRLWTPKWWDCEVCRGYFLCDNCYKGSLDKSEVLSAPPQVHSRDHPMSAYVPTSTCDGCGSFPIWNLRWHCGVCRDFDLCEACYKGLDVWDMSEEHSQEHPMIDVEVIYTKDVLKFQPSFNKPVDPQWSFKVDGDLLHYGFEWVKRKPMSRVSSGMGDEGNHTLGNANEDNGAPTSKLKVIQLSSNESGEVPLAYSTLRMGLFGMGGSGKTTMCKVFRNQIAGHYLGKVCHLEFGSVDLLQLRVKLLQSICQLASSLLQTVDEGQALTLLKIHIPKQRVCLIIDNVSDNLACIEEARTLLNLPFKEGSLILVTSRSSTVLENLKIEKRLTMRVPSLTIGEAKALFSHHAGCDTSNLTEEQMKAMESFVERCNFKVKGMASEEFHPLALKVLGTRVGPNVEEWQSIRIDFKSYESEDTHPIFSILRSSFVALDLEYQRLFLDIALVSSDAHINLRMGGLEWQMRCLYGETDKQFSFQVVKVLQAKSLVEDIADNTIYVHDLYREFAEVEVKRKGLQHTARCCFYPGSKRQHAIQEGRVRIHDHPVSHITKDILSCTLCSETELLSIQDCAKLVSVEVPGMVNLRMFDVIGGCPQLKSVNLKGAVNLKSLDWRGFEGEYPDLTSLESLEELRIQNDEAQSPATVHGCLDFSKTCNLEVLYLSYLPLDVLNLNRVVLLKVLVLENCQHVEQFEGLEALVLLQIFVLKVCSSLVKFPSLANFHLLESFYLEGAAKLKTIDGFANLSALQVLSLMDGRQLKVLPGIEACTRLTKLDLSGTSIGDCSWISTMEDLTFIDLSGSKIRFVPDCSGLCKLGRLWLEDCQALESTGVNAGSISPTFPQSLQILGAASCRILNATPQFHHESALHYLDLSGSSVEDVSGVTCCKQLQKLFLVGTRITSLPDLSSLTRLEVLGVHGCELLTRMDNTKSLPALEALSVFGCSSLLTLPDLRSSTGLTCLSLRGCPLVDPNAVKFPSGTTIDMDMEDAADDNQYSDNDVEAQECEHETSALMNFQAPEPAQNPGYLQHFLTWCQWVGSWCGGLVVNRANAD